MSSEIPAVKKSRKGRFLTDLEKIEIEQLPDYPALCQVRNALWRIGEIYGAAVMIGAGFSRFADRVADTTPLAPLWPDFHEAMLEELYPKGNGSSDPLALAEEYGAALGDSALENLIRSKIRDTERNPGEIHRRLLSLPWMDVLTTNWDTLLERSAESNTDIPFDVVRVPHDITRTKSPRIVKLHGSLPSHSSPLIFTEEDFRTYPTLYAPFVNLVQQVLLENELCLLGFSGEDPNFLKWSGWVRDHLGAMARPIRLVGVLNLSDSRRHFLRGRNITPIDLAPIIPDDLNLEDHHRYAIEVFLEFLEEGKPSKAKWSPTPYKESDQNVPESDSQLTRIMEIWKRDRETHPGWLVTPPPLRATIRNNLSESRKLFKSDLFTNASKSTRASALYEAVWLSEIAFWPLPDFLENAVSDMVKTNDDSSLSLEHQILLRTAIIRIARYRRDWVTFDQRIQFLDMLDDPAAKVEALYERCLRAKDELDYKFLAINAKNIVGSDPIWLLRRAALIAELGDASAASKLIYETHHEIQQARTKDRRSLWLLSREAWTSWLKESARFALEEYPFDEQADWPPEYKANDTDPWDELQYLEGTIKEADRWRHDNLLDREPQFDAGTYSAVMVPTTTYTFSSPAVTSPYNDLNLLAEHVGIPLELNIMDILGWRLARAVQVLDEDYSSVGIWASVHAVIAKERKTIEDRFNRVAVACLEYNIASEIVQSLRNAIVFGKDRLLKINDDGSTGQNMFWNERIRILTELLSRLSMRFQGDEALDLFRFGISLAHDPNFKDKSVLKSVSNLLFRSLKTLEPERHGEAALDVLLLPFSCEKEISESEFIWMNVFNALDNNAWQARKRNREWSSQVASLINTVSDNSSNSPRPDATYRLLKLFAYDKLKKNEARDFGKAIWKHIGNNGFPANTNLVPHIFLQLPSPNPDASRQIFNKEVVVELAHGSLNEDLLQPIIGISYSLKDRYKPYRISPEHALNIVNHALDWKSQTTSVNSTFWRKNFNDRKIPSLIASALASTVLPSLQPSEITENQTRAFIDRASDGSFPELLIALPELTRLNQSLTEEATKAIQKGMISQDPDIVGAALAAVFRFYRLKKQQDIPKIPKKLIDETVSICLMRREPGLISALNLVRLFVNSGTVSTLDQHQLVHALELLDTETNYENWRDESRRSDVGLIRKKGVRLAVALKNAGFKEPVLNEWIETSPSDPMPEVRYALPVDEEI